MWSDPKFHRKLFSPFILILLMTAMPSRLVAQSQEKMYSLMILNFAKTIYWPLSPNENKFIIGVLEYPPLVTELRQSMTTLKINGRSLIIRELASPEEAMGCNIVFLPAYKGKLLSKLVVVLDKQPTLIVSNKPGIARNGGGINFVLINGKLNYEINCAAIEKRGMKVSTAIKSTGIIVVQ